MLAVTVAATTLTLGIAGAAQASPGAVLQPGAAVVTAEALPTAQIDGVVWSQAVVGDLVYAAGKFGTARPAGSAPGTNTVVRNNLLRYTLSTGALDAGFAPSLNAQARVLAVSPDQTRVYVGGDFTLAGGAQRARIAAYNASTGALITTFAPRMNGPIKAIAVTNTTVYIGGSFTTANGVARSRLAAFRASDGALYPWAPKANADVLSLVVAPGATKVIAGGHFTTMNGVASYGMAALNPTTGARLTWNTTTVVRDAGVNSAILSLSTDGRYIYGTGYVYGSGGNLEGAFAANPSSGDIVWIEDCHGDTYSHYVTNGTVYVVGHPHYCGNVGGFGQYAGSPTQRALAFTANPTGTLLTNPVHGYANFGGKPSPSLINWFPDLTVGTVTGAGQAAWSVTGNSRYIVLGGEFTAVNGVGQQGLTRFAVAPTGPATQGPRVSGAALQPTVFPTSATAMRVVWTADWDRDDQVFSYVVLRDGVPVYTTTATSQFWHRPTLSFLDQGVSPGPHSYRVSVIDRSTAADPTGNTVLSSTVRSDRSMSAYSEQVALDGATGYWPLTEAGDPLGYDHVAAADLGLGTGVSHATDGPLPTSTSAAFAGTTAGTAANATAAASPTTFTVQAWVRTTSTTGGKVIGFGNATSGSSTHYDRHLYLDNAGRVHFGIFTGAFVSVTSPAPVNDGAWHQLTGTADATGITLYVDGNQVARLASTAAVINYPGYWRLGGDNLAGWPAAPTSAYLAGAIGQAAVYPTVLTAGQVSTQYGLGRSGAPLSLAPTAAFTNSVQGLTVNLDASSSTDLGGTLTGWSWNFGDGSTGDGAVTSHAFAAAGTYSVTLTVTDDQHATASVTMPVTVTDPTG